MSDDSQSDDKTQEAPPEAADASLSSSAKDAFFADPPQPTSQPVTDAVATDQPYPDEPKHRSYDVRARNTTEEDADFEADAEASEEDEDNNDE
jgi:hypothetical protein